MKTINFLLLFLSISFSNAQEIEAILGEWNGTLNVQGTKLPLVLKISESEGKLTGTLDSPAQNAYGIQITRIMFSNDSLEFSVDVANISYKGVLEEHKFKGKFKQGMFTTDLNLQREKQEIKASKRPQEPKKPYPYNEEEVAFFNEEDQVHLAGTFTYPKGEGKFPAVILISGSGAQDRNSEILGHKPFLVIADYLTRKGVAVLRYDDRGTADSQGDFGGATSNDFANDASAAIEFLSSRPEVNLGKIGIIGHSEGGMIAPMLANNPNVSFLVLIAPPVAPIDELMLLQQELVGEVSGMSPSEISLNREINKSIYALIKSTDENEINAAMDKFLDKLVKEYPEIPKSAGISSEVYKSVMKEAYLDPWMLYFIKFDPKENLIQTKIPFLALFGEKDVQVSAVQNATLLKNYALKNNRLNRVKTLKDLNHLMQTSTTGSPAEYAEIDETFAEKALQEIHAWMKDAKIVPTEF